MSYMDNYLKYKNNNYINQMVTKVNNNKDKNKKQQTKTDY